MRFKFIVSICLFLVFCTGQAVISYKQVPDGIKIILQDGILGIYPLSENVARINFYKEPEVQVPELVFTSKVKVPEFQISDSPSKLEITEKNLVVTVDKQTGKLSFANNSGRIFLNETAGSRKLTPGSVMDEPCFADAKKVLTINDRSGSFPGMPAKRKFSIILAGKSNGAGMIMKRLDKEVTYAGKKVEVKL
jgi:alpha-D-xyloside xylohydrolase